VLNTALPDSTNNIGMFGPGRDALTIQRNPAAGTPNFRIFRIAAGSTSLIDDVTITNGSVTGDGGGILNQGNLELDRTDLYSNAATGWGGAIYNGSGTLQVTWCHMWGNDGNSGGGIANASGQVTINETSEIFANQATTGGAIYNGLTGKVTISQFTTIYANTATSNGGGIWNSGTLSMDGGELYNNNGQEGGGIFNNSGTATISNVSITQNRANTGGGFFQSTTGRTDFAGCTISNNTASDQGAGGAWQAGGVYTVNNCTITDPIVQV
jgi:hypothetical protein